MPVLPVRELLPTAYRHLRFIDPVFRKYIAVLCPVMLSAESSGYLYTNISDFDAKSGGRLSHKTFLYHPHPYTFRLFRAQVLLFLWACRERRLYKAESVCAVRAGKTPICAPLSFINTACLLSDDETI